MNWPEDLALLPVEEASRRIALRQLKLATAAWERLEGVADADALHDLRVALRRLRTCLKAYAPHLEGSAPRRLGREVRALARATARSRDLEVHIAWLTSQEGPSRGEERAGLAWLKERLRRRKRVADAEWRSAVQDRFPKLRRRLSRRLSRYTRRLDAGRPLPEIAAGIVAGRLLCEAAEDLRVRLQGSEALSDRAKSHRVRIAVKRLRYLLEPYAAAVEGGERLEARLRQLQDALGELNDARLLGDEVIAAPGKRAYRPRDDGLPDAGLAGRVPAVPATDAGAFGALLSVVPIMKARWERALAQLRGEWLGGGMEELLQLSIAVGRQLVELPGQGLEVERKYLLNGLPEVAGRADCFRIEQGWILGDRIAERFRRICADGRARCFRTIKSGSGLRRIEIEEQISEELFERVWPLTEGRRVQKLRYQVPDGNRVWSVDKFVDQDLVLAEVELTAEDSRAEPPEWLRDYVVREVTGEPRYLNMNLAG